MLNVLVLFVSIKIRFRFALSNKNKMKLELKHITHYLPYGLKVQWKDKKTTTINPYIEDDNAENEASLHLVLYAMSEDYGIKPLLRPLSDLTKEIEHNGETFVPIENLKELYNSYPDSYIEKLNYIHWEGVITLFGTEEDDSYEVSMPYSLYEKLLEWHFDIFGLIEKGLAVDINLLK